jgi:hypothetical protein
MRLIILCALVFNAHAAFKVKKLVSNNKSNIVSVTHVETEVKERVLLRNIREMIAERVPTPEVMYQEELIPEYQASEKIKSLSYKKSMTPYIAGSEVREIIKQGKDSNRIILTVLGDGYTEAEREKFFDDVDRIVGDLFREVTFKSYLKLFNIYAVFVPSRDSGITDMTQKDTAFGLYRSPRGSKRGIMPGNRSAIEKALDLAPAPADYPIIIANDDFYGGLGGRYAITTRSHNSGSMVLRHELGHNFSNVGEEYDGGQVYSGANFSSSSNVSWGHWINGATEVHQAKFLTGSYVWQKLYDENFSKTFNFPNDDNYFYSLKLSSVGWEHADDVHVYLDGQRLDLDGVYTEDRSFFYTKNVDLTKGSHKIEIKDHSHDGNNVLAYANGYAYPKSYNFKAGVIGAFNVFDSNGNERGFRPTHDDCLMRDMRSMVFCPVDQENIWLRFFKKMNLIEAVEDTGTHLKVHLLDLGQKVSVKWYKKSFWGAGDELTQLDGKLSVLKSDLKKGKYVIKAITSHPEVIKEKIITEREIKL